MKGHKKRLFDPKDIRELIKEIELAETLIDEAFEPIEKLIRRNIQLAEELLGIQ